MQSITKLSLSQSCMYTGNSNQYYYTAVLLDSSIQFGICAVANKSTCYTLVRDYFFLVVYSTPTSEKASHSYTKTAPELIGGIHVKRGTVPPLVNSVTRQFPDVPQCVV